MRIEFDPTNPDEAAAVRAMLTAMHPTAPRYDPTAQPATLIFEEKVHSEDGGMTVNLTDSTITVASEHNEETNPKGVDENGEPWDARIHSTPAKTNADGTWRAKRGVKAEEIAAIKAERDTEREPVATNETNAPVGEQEVMVPDLAAAAQALYGGAVIPAPAPKAPPAPPAPTVHKVEIDQNDKGEPVVGVAPSFLDVMKAITAAQKDGKIDTAKVKELCAAVGAGESTMGLNGPDNGDKRGAFMALLASETEGK